MGRREGERDIARPRRGGGTEREGQEREKEKTGREREKPTCKHVREAVEEVFGRDSKNNTVGHHR